MKEIVVATGNKHKIREIAEMLNDPDIRLLSLSDVGFSGEIIEDGETFEDNAYIKARTVCRATGYATLADDSGICVDALGGEPGIYSARYAGVEGKNGADEANLQKLLDNLTAIPEAERTAHYVCAMALCLPDGREFCVKGICSGIITREKRGEGGFGYDPVFFYPPFSRTFGETSEEEKNGVSHRRRAVDLIAKIIRENISEEK